MSKHGKFKNKPEKRSYELTVHRPDGKVDVYTDVDYLDIDEGGYAKWRDPTTGLVNICSGMPVCAIELKSDTPDESDD